MAFHTITASEARARSQENEGNRVNVLTTQLLSDINEEIRKEIENVEEGGFSIRFSLANRLGDARDEFEIPVPLTNAINRVYKFLRSECGYHVNVCIDGYKENPHIDINWREAFNHEVK